MSDEREMLAEVLAEHAYDTGWRCSCDWTGSADEYDAHLAGFLLASPQFARLIAAAKAEALREAADEWQWGEWTVLTPKVKRGGTAAVVGGAQVVTDWLRNRAALTAEPVATEGEGA